MITWENVIGKYPKESLEFADGELSLRQFMKKVNLEARKELRLIERHVGAAGGRVRIRKALRRRGLLV